MKSGSFTIAIIDDDPRICDLFKKMIAAYSEHSVLSASDGGEGLTLVIDRTPDVVILDINMPKMNGLQVLEKIRKHPRTLHIPVIMLTGNISRESTSKSKCWRADAFLAKPCGREEFMAAISSALSSCNKAKPVEKVPVALAS